LIVKPLVLVARILLGLIFLVFGLNGFFSFIPAPPPSGVAGQYFGALYVSNYIHAVFVLKIVVGVLLFVNRFVLLALAILAPILVNIALALWVVLFVRERAVFSRLLLAKGVS
jgi:hypothetical protein